MQIFWIELSKVRYNDFFQEITKLQKQNIVFTPNPEILIKTQQDHDFKVLLQKAHYLTPDGIGLYIAFQILDNNYSKLINIALLPYFFFRLFFQRSQLYKKYGERICGSDITHDLLIFSQTNNIKISIIDLYNPNDLSKVKSQRNFPQLLQEKFPNLQFEYHIYNPSKKVDIIHTIKSSDAQILFSTLGMKKQEESISEIMAQCPNIKLGLGVWSSFDYFIWFQKRAPKIWRQLWIEWLYRILTWPDKITRIQRIYTAIFVFLFKVLQEK